ncbi:MAG: OsmC family protein [Candidatus Thermoplasmatota archaeon]
MDMRIYFPGGKKVNAEYKGFTIATDQPLEAGGTGTAPEPLSLFLISLGTCTGYYVLAFCQKHNIPTDNITIVMKSERNEKTHLYENITLTIATPSDFPETYKKALVKAAESCAVKKHLEKPPKITILAP